MKERGTFKVHYQNLDRTLRLGTTQRTSEILLKGAFFYQDGTCFGGETIRNFAHEIQAFTITLHTNQKNLTLVL